MKSAATNTRTHILGEHMCVFLLRIYLGENPWVIVYTYTAIVDSKLANVLKSEIIYSDVSLLS